MLVTRVVGSSSLRKTRPGPVVTAAFRRSVPRTLSSKPPDKPVPTPEEEAERQATQMKALETVLKTQNSTGKLRIHSSYCS